MTEKYNSRKWIAFCWFMGLVTLAIILAFVCMFMHYDYPEVIVDILVLSGFITAGYCGINVLNKKVTNMVPPEPTEKSTEDKGEEDEHSASSLYSQIIESTDNEEVKKVLTEIMNDEIQHIWRLTDLVMLLDKNWETQLKAAEKEGENEWINF